VKIECLLFGPPYMGEKARMENFGGKECGINVWCSWEHIGTLRNIIGTMQGHTGNMLRKQNLRNFIHAHPPPFPSSVPKGKKDDPS